MKTHPAPTPTPAGRRLPAARAFTLIELLTVIVIIGVLAGLLLPALKGARDSAKKTKAQTTINGVSIALKAYNNEYGFWPLTASGGSVPNAVLTAVQNQRLIELLGGSDVYLDGSAGGNPRRIQFLGMKTSETNAVSTTASNGVYPITSGGGAVNLTDPWNNSYMFRFDDDGDNKVETYGGATTIPGGFAIWSAGPDKKVNTTATDADNTDNLTSWK